MTVAAAKKATQMNLKSQVARRDHDHSDVRSALSMPEMSSTARPVAKVPLQNIHTRTSVIRLWRMASRKRQFPEIYDAYQLRVNGASYRNCQAYINRRVEHSASGVDVVACIAMRSEPDQINN